MTQFSAQLSSSQSFSHLSKPSLLILLSDSLSQLKTLKLQLLLHQSQLFDCTSQLQLLKSKASTQSDTCLLMMYTQQRNVDKIERLQREVSGFKGRYGKENIGENGESWKEKGRDTEWEGKYRELERHMELYIGNSNQVQEELLQGCRKMKRERERVLREYEKQIGRGEEWRLRWVGAEEKTREMKQEIEREKREMQQQRINFKQELQQLRFSLLQKQPILLSLQPSPNNPTLSQSHLSQSLRSLQFRYSGLSKQRDILSSQLTDLHKTHQHQKHQSHILKSTISKLQQYNKGLLERLIEPMAVSGRQRESVTERGLVEEWSGQVGRLREENKRLKGERVGLEEKVRVIDGVNQELLKENLKLSSELRMERSKEGKNQKWKEIGMERGKQEDTEGESTIMNSLEQNCEREKEGTKNSNFLSYGGIKRRE